MALQLFFSTFIPKKHNVWHYLNYMINKSWNILFIKLVKPYSLQITSFFCNYIPITDDRDECKKSTYCTDSHNFNKVKPMMIYELRCHIQMHRYTNAQTDKSNILWYTKHFFTSWFQNEETRNTSVVDKKCTNDLYVIMCISIESFLKQKSKSPDNPIDKLWSFHAKCIICNMKV